MAHDSDYHLTVMKQMPASVQLSQIEDALREREERHATLVAETDRISAEIAELKTALGVIWRYATTPAQAAITRQVDGTSTASPKVVLGAAQSILAEQGAMPLSALHSRLVERGFNISSADPVQYLSTMLSRHKDQYGFITSRKFGWSVAPAVAAMAEIEAESAQRAELTPVGEQAIRQATEVETDDL